MALLKTLPDPTDAPDSLPAGAPPARRPQSDTPATSHALALVERLPGGPAHPPLALLRPNLPAPARLDTHPAAVYLASLAPGSRRTMRESLDVIARILGTHDAQSCPWADLRFQHTAAVRARLTAHYKPATANKMLSALRGVLKAAFELGQIPAEEYGRARAVKPVRGGSLPAGRALTDAEVQALVATCEKSAAGSRDRAAILVLWACGLRRAELSGLDLADYQVGAATLRVRGKGGKEREVPVNRAAAAALRVWLKRRGQGAGPLYCPCYGDTVKTDRRLTPQAVLAILSRLGERAGIGHFSPHDLRRTMISNVLDRGGDISTAQQLAGHASVVTTARYDRRGDEAKRRATDLLQIPGVDDWE